MKQKITKEETIAILQGTAFLDYFQEDVYKKYPQGAKQLRAFIENITEDHFPSEDVLAEVVSELIDQQIEALSKIGEKYAQ